ncbi:MAG TPA: MBL fold metallo-hydrolase [Gammaproteobacteria bacterium]|jgi:glyoxylase-like metal-dependent hydrolase (beta-lactamase superfamily II)|nr:MBL fold metallo-hydrolase [Gammaproteobacteria bacterium]HAE70245.1 MBL fold metallo-hydrolase [Gammaproteobacteria bacterium]HAE72904.1 MBL fold metallo-hydrolase [Gammaproteobacteria bacterium]HAG47513.1 MBL fold metallo-hydrolase [Gammaproteobacteria bacterium]HAN33131.1 MBL fold metallo-hydrolase [Gammaproteobacteria bacterium]
MKILTLLLILLAFSVQAEEYEAVDVEVKAQKLIGDAYYVPGMSGAATEYEGFISNAGFVVTNEGVVVFDALGTPSLAHAMLGEIRKITDQPIKIVVMSHYHADHLYGLQVFKDEGAQVWAPKGTWDYLDSETAETLLDSRRTALFPWVTDDTYLVKPDRIIDQDIKFSLGGHEFMINYFGKVHSDGDMSLLSVKDQTLYSGDIIFEGRLPFVGDANIIDWVKTLERMQHTQVDYFVPGHGSASNQPQQTMDLTYRYLKFLLEKLSKAVEDMEQFEETYEAIDWSEFENETAFDIANRMNAYAVYLFLEKTLD